MNPQEGRRSKGKPVIWTSRWKSPSCSSSFFGTPNHCTNLCSSSSSSSVFSSFLPRRILAVTRTTTAAMMALLFLVVAHQSTAMTTQQQTMMSVRSLLAVRRRVLPPRARTTSPSFFPPLSTSSSSSSARFSAPRRRTFLLGAPDATATRRLATYRGYRHHHPRHVLSSSSSSSSSSSAAPSPDPDSAAEAEASLASASASAPAADRERTNGAKKVPSRFVPYPFSYREEVVMEIDSLTNRGWGIGRVPIPSDDANGGAGAEGDDEDEVNDGQEEKQGGSKSGGKGSAESKWVVMVPNVIPGEIVRVRVFRNYRNYSEADLLEVVRESPDRVDPACSLSGVCGGCQYQHVSIEAQRRWKTRHVEESLRQHAVNVGPGGDSGAVEVAQCFGTSHVLGYRSKLTPHYQAPKARRRPQDAVAATASDDDDDTLLLETRDIGFQRQTSRQIVDVEFCPIATDPINEEYRRVREEILARDREEHQHQLLQQQIDERIVVDSGNNASGKTARRGKKKKKKQKGATLLFRQANLGDTHVYTNHKDSIATTVNGLNFTYLAGNFFQNNYHVLPTMVDHVVQGAVGEAEGGSGGSSTKMTHLVDCYCGSGLFALSAAAHFEQVVGIEINQKAIEEASANAAANGISNSAFVAATAADIFSQIRDFPRDTTAVVVDPPRKGCSDEFLEQLYEFKPKRIVYLSCDPATQARDARGILEDSGGGYRITSIQPFDLFPMTRHIENLIVFERE